MAFQKVDEINVSQPTGGFKKVGEIDVSGSAVGDVSGIPGAGIISDTLTNMQQDAPEIIGGVGGSIVGGTVGSRIGAPAIGRTVGAFTGGALGKGAQIGYNALTGTEAPPSMGETAMEMGMAGLRQGGAQLGGEVIGGALGNIGPMAERNISGSLASKKVTPEAVTAQNTVHDLSKGNLSLTPSKTSSGFLHDVGENVAEKSIIGGGTMMRHNDEIENLLQTTLKNMAGSDIDPDILGALVEKSRLTNYQNATAPAKQLYNKVNDITLGAGGVQVDISPVKKLAADLYKQAESEEFINSKNYADDLMGRIANAENLKDINSIIGIRSRLLNMQRQMNTPGTDLYKSPSSKNIGTLIDQFDKSAENSLADFDKYYKTNTLNTWRQANEIYKKAQDTYKTQFLMGWKKLAEEEPDRVIDWWFRRKAGVRAKEIMTAVGENSPTADQLRYGLIQKIIEPKEMGEQLTGSQLATNFQQYMKPLKVVLKPEQYESLQNVITALKTQQTPSKTQAGSLAIQFAQWGGSGFAMTTGHPLTAGLVLGGPAVWSRIITNPYFANLMIKGFSDTSVAATREFTANLSRAIIEANKGLPDDQKARIVKNPELEKQLFQGGTQQ